MDRKGDHNKARYLSLCTPFTSSNRKSTLSVEGSGCDRGRDQEASSGSSVIELGDNESESSGHGVDMVTPERAGGLPARVLLTLRLPLTARRIVPISCLLHCAPGKQKDLPNISSDRNA